MNTNTDPVRTINVGALKVPVGEAAKRARDAAHRLVGRHRIFQAATGGKGDPFDSEVANLLFAGAAALDALASAPASAPEPEVHSYDPTDQRQSVTIRWPDGKCLGYVLDRTRYTDNLPPSAPVGVDDALIAGAMEAAADACSRHVVCNEAIAAAVEYALAQQPAAPSGEAVAWAAMSAAGSRVVSISLERDEYVGHVVPLYTAPQQPAGVDEAETTRIVANALRSTGLVTNSDKWRAAEAVIAALAAQQQEQES